MSRLARITAFVAVLLLGPLAALGEIRFPPPEFESGYQLPQATTPPSSPAVHEYVDAAVLLGALLLASYLILKRRSRRAIFALTIFSLLYFGFARHGCICPVGAIQNVTLTVFDSGYAMPITVGIFFILPLVLTLFFGRMFCGAVCPLGAIQDVVLIHPVTVPRWLESGLRLLAYTYLGSAVLFAALGSAFVICRYDPFVGFFRLSGNWNVIVLGSALLVIGLFVGRPYCRFLCPYGVILRQMSRLSKWRVTITPDECIECRLCEQSCPFGAIREPTGDWPRGEYLPCSLSCCQSWLPRAAGRAIRSKNGWPTRIRRFARPSEFTWKRRVRSRARPMPATPSERRDRPRSSCTAKRR
jgi:NosR/NirI family nitrous oxide reductase transcriptional regulator